MTSKIIGLCALLVLGGCASQQTVAIGDNGCGWVKPITVSKHDRLTNNTATQILAHDDKWQRFCGK